MLSTKAKKIVRAKRLLKSYTGADAHGSRTVRVPAPPDVAIAIGPVLAIIYQGEHDGTRYIHKFNAASRPRLIASYDGNKLAMIGGSFHFTNRGIVDKPATKRKR